jgi:hypothetical protein
VSTMSRPNDRTAPHPTDGKHGQRTSYRAGVPEVRPYGISAGDCIVLEKIGGLAYLLRRCNDEQTHDSNPDALLSLLRQCDYLD